MNITLDFIQSVKDMIGLPKILEAELRANIGQLEAEHAKVKIERVKLMKQLRRLQNEN